VATLHIYSKRTTIYRYHAHHTAEERGTYHLTALGASSRGFQRAEADRQHQFVSQAQAGLYSLLPTHNQAGELMDARYFRAFPPSITHFSSSLFVSSAQRRSPKD
jgi:hypothetical protein